MKKKKSFLIILLVLGTLILAFGFVLNFTSSNNKNNSNNESKKSDLIEKWYYVDFEFYDENGNMLEKVFNMEDFYLDFYTKTVDVCYDKCYTTTYTKDNNILTIDDFDYFSGKFEVSYKDNMMLLKTITEGTYIIYYFGKPIDAE
ncbi:MAG: hypothetical protein SPJ06_00805 [Bacilli bacterium]|nr:hypothetical protein [Bacilli bacterium]